MMTLRYLFIGIAAALLVCVLTPGAEAIKVKRIGRGDDQTLAPRETTFDFEIPSAETLQTLRLLNLDGRLGDNNVAVIAILNGYRRAAPQPEIVAAEAELYFLRAQRLESGFRKQAAGWYLLAASRSYEYLVDALEAPSEVAFDLRIVQMNDLYSRAVGAYLRFLREKGGGVLDHDRKTLIETFRVVIEEGPELLDPSTWDSMLVSRDLRVKGLRNYYRRGGIGTTLVTVQDNPQRQPVDRLYPPEGIINPATAVIRFESSRDALESSVRIAMLSFWDPREVRSIAVGQTAVPLAGDFTTPYAYLLAQGEIRRLARDGLRKTEELEALLGLYLLEPYDPDKIPIVMVHGIRSSALAWMELTNDIIGDPDFRDSYQVWQYVYPTSLPYLSAAVLLRRSIEAARQALDPDGADAATSSMVIVAHSMGGLLAKTMVVDSGLELWNTTFRVPPDELAGVTQDRNLMAEGLIFAAKPYVNRVVFISTPHRGSALAGSLVGHLGSGLMDLPEDYQDLLRRVSEANPDAVTLAMLKILEKGGPTSIRALAPDYPLLEVFAELPIDERVPYHSIMGDRGENDGDKRTDGVVPYESAHLEGAESELVVPSGHSAYAHPAAIAEIRRILKRHLVERE
jgi:pimeloyl-ACP methyl ester carboxylesterase